jgi:hypothetical protein
MSQHHFVSVVEQVNIFTNKTTISHKYWLYLTFLLNCFLISDCLNGIILRLQVPHSPECNITLLMDTNSSKMFYCILSSHVHWKMVLLCSLLLCAVYNSDVYDWFIGGLYCSWIYCDADSFRRSKNIICFDVSLLFFVLFSVALQAMASSFLRFLDHTQWRITVGRTPLDEWSARRRDIYLPTHNTDNRQTSMPPVGFEPTISASERPQTYVLGPTGTGDWLYCCDILRVEWRAETKLKLKLIHNKYFSRLV